MITIVIVMPMLPLRALLFLSQYLYLLMVLMSHHSVNYFVAVATDLTNYSVAAATV